MKTGKLLSATATPLASIFGSGFLVIVPILAGATGPYSLPAMVGVCGFAFLVGSVIRFNIANVEPGIESGKAGKTTRDLERVSDLSLVLAYVISVTLYLRILSAFIIGGIGAGGAFEEKLITSAVIFLISFVGFSKGLETLQKLESWALWATMGIIAVVIISFGSHDLARMLGTGLDFPDYPDHSFWHMLAILGGILICVQGFETSRYLGEEYDTATRIKSCRLSQIIATCVYIAFIAVATPLMSYLTGPPRDDALIFLAGKVFFLLPIPLVTAAVLSQFSAAVADTLGGEGNIVETSQQMISRKIAYLVIGVGAFVLTWIADTFQIVTLASRAFAFYYMIQCFVAVTVARGTFRKVWMMMVAVILLGITVFAIPVS